MNTTITQNQANIGQARRQEYIRPHYEVQSSEQEHTVRVLLPGVAKDRTTITLEKSTLMVEAQRSDHWSDKGRLLHREIPTADYRLRLQLNVRIDESAIAASHNDGVLNITLPVAEEAKPRTIAIQ